MWIGEIEDTVSHLENNIEDRELKDEHKATVTLILPKFCYFSCHIIMGTFNSTTRMSNEETCKDYDPGGTSAMYPQPANQKRRFRVPQPVGSATVTNYFSSLKQLSP